MPDSQPPPISQTPTDPGTPTAIAAAADAQAIHYIPKVLMGPSMLLVNVAGSIAMASVMGVDMSFVPSVVPKVCALVAFIGMNIGFVGPAVFTKAKP